MTSYYKKSLYENGVEWLQQYFLTDEDSLKFNALNDKQQLEIINTIGAEARKLFAEALKKNFKSKLSIAAKYCLDNCLILENSRYGKHDDKTNFFTTGLFTIRFFFGTNYSLINFHTAYFKVFRILLDKAVHDASTQVLTGLLTPSTAV